MKDQGKELSSTTRTIMKKTGYLSKQSFPKKYPYDYFERCSIEESNIIDLIDTINCHDVYNQLVYYRTDDHKNYLAYHYQANQAYFLNSHFHIESSFLSSARLSVPVIRRLALFYQLSRILMNSSSVWSLLLPCHSLWKHSFLIAPG